MSGPVSPAKPDWRQLPPLDPDSVPERPERLSQTLLSTFGNCPRSAMLYVKHGGGAPSHEMHRGTLFHEFAEKATLELIAQGESRMPPDLAKSWMQDIVAAHPELAVPTREYDALRLMAWNWAEHTVIDPDTILGVEKKLRLDIGGVTISGKVDLAYAVNPLCIGIRDYKTTLAMPQQEDFELSFQGPFYALLLADGRDEDGLALGKGVRYFELSELYPRYTRQAGGLAGPEPLVLDRERILDKRVEVEQLVASAVHAWESREFAALPGTWCGKCAARAECPLPTTLRPRSQIQTAEDAQKAADWLVVMSGYNNNGSGGRVKLIRDGLRTWVNENEPVRSGDVEWGFTAMERRTTDVEGMTAQAERAARFGEPFDADDYVRVRTGSSFGKRKVTEEDSDG